jgi:hypothetical protein
MKGPTELLPVPSAVPEGTSVNQEVVLTGHGACWCLGHRLQPQNYEEDISVAHPGLGLLQPEWTKAPIFPQDNIPGLFLHPTLPFFN